MDGRRDNSSRVGSSSPRSLATLGISERCRGPARGCSCTRPPRPICLQTRGAPALRRAAPRRGSLAKRYLGSKRVVSVSPDSIVERRRGRPTRSTRQSNQQAPPTELNEMLRFVRLLAPATRVVPPMSVSAPARGVAVFRGSYIAKPSSCVNIRVNHPKYKKSKDGAAMVLATPGTIAFEIAPGAGGAKASSEDADPASGGYQWEKKLSYNISASDIIQLLSWVPSHEVGPPCGKSSTRAVLSDASRLPTSPSCPAVQDISHIYPPWRWQWRRKRHANALPSR